MAVVPRLYCVRRLAQFGCACCAMPALACCLQAYQLTAMQLCSSCMALLPNRCAAYCWGVAKPLPITSSAKQQQQQAEGSATMHAGNHKVTRCATQLHSKRPIMSVGVRTGWMHHAEHAS
jgi:hypothetical protein